MLAGTKRGNCENRQPGEKIWESSAKHALIGGAIDGERIGTPEAFLRIAAAPIHR